MTSLPRIDQASAVPLYVQLEAVLLERIESGEWPPGHQIPTEAELCDAFSVSRVTVRRALSQLVNRGLVQRERGRGSFVRSNRVAATARTVASFTNELSNLGMKAGAHILSAAIIAADTETAEAMECDEGDDVVEIRRVRTADGQPIGLQVSNLLAVRVPGILDHLRDDVSLYDLLRTRYGIVPTEAHEVFRVTNMPAETAAVLDVEPGAVAFSVERITFDGTQAFEFTKSLIRGDSYEVRLALRNP